MTTRAAAQPTTGHLRRAASRAVQEPSGPVAQPPVILRRNVERQLVRQRCVCGTVIVCLGTNVRNYICNHCDRVCCTMHSRHGAQALAAVPGLVEAARARGTFCVEGTLCTWCIADLSGQYPPALAVVIEEHEDVTDSEPLAFRNERFHSLPL